MNEISALFIDPILQTTNGFPHQIFHGEASVTASIYQHENVTTVTTFMKTQTQTGRIQHMLSSWVLSNFLELLLQVKKKKSVHWVSGLYFFF